MVGVSLDALNGDRRVGANDEQATLGFALLDGAKLGVVHLVAMLHGLGQAGIDTVFAAHQRKRAILLLHIAFGLGQHDDVSTVADALEELDRDGIGHAAVQQLLVVDFDDLGDDGHGGRRANPVEAVVSIAFVLVVDGKAGLNVSADDVEVHGIALECAEIKGIEAQRNLAIAEFRAEDISGGEQRAEPTVARIAAVFGVVAERAANLAGFVVAAEGRAGGYADHAVEGDSAL